MSATPGPWAVTEDPMDNRNYKTLVVKPGRAGSFGTWLALVQHNWNDAEAGEHRISWKEAECNARLISAAPDLLEALERLLAASERHIFGDECLAERNAARAAIAKARGTS